jgi:hypothetical protein
MVRLMDTYTHGFTAKPGHRHNVEQGLCEVEDDHGDMDQWLELLVTL